jgi:hypothetical protein
VTGVLTGVVSTDAGAASAVVNILLLAVFLIFGVPTGDPSANRTLRGGVVERLRSSSNHVGNAKGVRNANGVGNSMTGFIPLPGDGRSKRPPKNGVVDDADGVKSPGVDANGVSLVSCETSRGLDSPSSGAAVPGVDPAAHSLDGVGEVGL